MPKMKNEVITNTKSGTIVAKCVCKHLFQDQHYGAGNRLMNITSNGKGRCTVCSRVQTDK